jgi:hypothetical protein
VTITEQVTKTGLLVNSAFHREPGTLILPITLNPPFRGGRSRSFFESADGMMSGWFQSRSVNAMHLQRVRPSRARLELVADVGNQSGGTPRIASTLEVDVEELFVATADGQVWRCTNLTAGGRADLQPSSAEEAQSAWKTWTLDTGKWMERISGNSGRLVPGSFIGRIAQGGAIAIPTLNFSWKRDDALLAGTLPTGAP